MKKCLIAIAALAALAGCNDHSDLKRGIMECKTAGEILDVGDPDEPTMEIHRQVMQMNLGFEITAQEFRDLRSQIFKDWSTGSEEQRNAKARSVLDSPQCRAMLR